MSPSLPPFQPRSHLPFPQLTAAKRKSLRRLKIFPNYRARLPTSNAPCARFRIWKQDLNIRMLQLRLLKGLKQELTTLSSALVATTAEHQRLFALFASVHNITTSFAPSPEDGCRESPIAISLSKQPLPSLSPCDVHTHRHCVKQDDMYIELMSRPSTPLPFCSPSPTNADSSPASPTLSFQPLPSEPANFHCASLRGPGYFIAEAYYHLNRSFGKHRRRKRNRHKH